MGRKSGLGGFPYGALIFMMGLSGFAQMPVFKRYYVADIPGLGWLAMFFVTHYIHYLGAILLLAILFYRGVLSIAGGGMHERGGKIAMVRRGILAGLVLTGLLLVVRNLPGYIFSPGMIIFLDLAHMGLAVLLMACGLMGFAAKRTSQEWRK